MKLKSILMFGALALFLVSSDFLLAARPLDEIVAVVDDDVILKSELNRAMRTYKRLRGETSDHFRQRVLDDLITAKAGKLAAKNAGIKVTDEEVDAAVQLIADRNQLSVGKMRAILKRQGIGYGNFREDIRKQLMQRKFSQQQLGSQVQVTESEIDDYLRLYGKQGTSKTVRQTHVRHILLRPGEQLANREAKERLEELSKEITDGESFENLARAYSDDTASALKGGDLGWVASGVATREFEQVMNKTAVNEVSPPFKTNFGWHILQVLERRDHVSADEAARSAAREKIQQRKIEESLELLTRRLREQAYVENRLLEPFE